MLAVIVGEFVVDQLVYLTGCSEGCLHFRIACHPHRNDDRDDEERHRRGEPPPPRPVGDNGERHRPEPDELAPQRRMRAGDRRPGLSHQRRQPTHQHRIARRRPDHRQMRRHPLVELDQFVDLGAGQPLAPLDQLLEPVPRRAVREHERVDIHLANPSSVDGYGRPGRTSGDRRRRRPRRADRPAAGPGAGDTDRCRGDLYRLHGRRDAVGGDSEPVRSRVVRCGAGHLHHPDDRRLSAGVRERDTGQDAGQDGARAAGGFRRRRPGTLPPGTFSRSVVSGGDLDVLRRTRGDLQPAIAEGQTDWRRVRRHRGDQ